MEIIKSKSETETIQIAEQFALKSLTPGSIVALYGDLGTGKTRFVQGICKAFKIKHNVTSPSFTIINEYKSETITIYHFDFYRISELDELDEIGFDDYIYSNSISIIEWADRIKPLLPEKRYDILLSLGEEENIRIIKIIKL